MIRVTDRIGSVPVGRNVDRLEPAFDRSIRIRDDLLFSHLLHCLCAEVVGECLR